jgi:phosphoglycolate phosphatase
VLHTLHAKGVRLSVATNAPTKFAVNMLMHLDVNHYFDVIIGADKVSASKPDPKMINEILKHYEFEHEKDEAWMIGDNSKDMDSAKNANIDSIFATWGFSPDSKYDKTIGKPDELLGIVL